MLKLLAMIQAYKKDESGATAIEYGLIAAGISIVLVTVVFAFGDQLEILFNNLTTELTARNAG